MQDAGPTPDIESRRAYLALVNADDCIKDFVIGCYLMQLQASIAGKMIARQKKVKLLIKKLIKTRKEAHNVIANKLEEADKA